MEQTQEEKKAAFMEKAANNKANFDLHKKLIAENLENWQEPQKSCIEHFYKTGKVSGSFFLALMEYAEKYHEARKV